MAIISLRAYARHRGVSLSSVQKAIKAGRITKTDDGGVDQDAADRSWARNADVAQARRPVAIGAAVGAQPPAGRDERADPPAGGVDYNKARAFREGYRAKREKIEYEKRVDSLVSAEDVRVAWTGILSSVRDSMLGLPLKLGGMLASMTDQRAIERYLKDAIRTELTKVAGQIDDSDSAVA